MLLTQAKHKAFIILWQKHDWEIRDIILALSITQEQAEIWVEEFTPQWVKTATKEII